MSIVERALQKARDKAKAAAGRITAAGSRRRGAAGDRSGSGAEPATCSRAGRASLDAADRIATRKICRSLRATSRPSCSSTSPSCARQAACLQKNCRNQLDDEIRRIKWPLLKAIEGSEGVRAARNNVVLVTSALPGEGKTFTSLNLALSIVRDREMRVVLVDGDVARPGLTPAIGLEDRPGLNDALEDEHPRHQFSDLPDRR